MRGSKWSRSTGQRTSTGARWCQCQEEQARGSRHFDEMGKGSPSYLYISHCPSGYFSTHSHVSNLLFAL